MGRTADPKPPARRPKGAAKASDANDKLTNMQQTLDKLLEQQNKPKLMALTPAEQNFRALTQEITDLKVRLHKLEQIIYSQMKRKKQ